MTNPQTVRLATHAVYLDDNGRDMAANVTVADAGGFFGGSGNVETALQYFASKDFGYLAHGNTGSTETFSSLIGWHSATLNAACTFTFTGATSGVLFAMVLELLQDATGSRLVTWPGSVVWPGGTAPVLSTTPAATDIFTFFSRDGGTTWYGFPTGGTGSGSALTIKDEGSSLATAATSIDFVGSGVTASGTGAGKTVTVAGATAASIAAFGFVGQILISDTPATPLVFADLIQNDDQTDLVYTDL